MRPLPLSFFARGADAVAADLVGCGLFVRGAGGTIVEVEAYGAEDPASHSFRGERVANRAMFGPPAHAYVYRSYGIHWCLNVVCRRGEAVLFRAIEPEAGRDAMVVRRGLEDARRLCAGPGRLAQALGVTGADDGRAFDGGEFVLAAGERPVRAVACSRIGISKARETPWRFVLEGSRFLSRPPGVRA